jgi:hypothetical protein
MTGCAYHAAKHTDAIWSALPGTYEELSLRSGLPMHTIRYRTREMRKDNLCHVGGWKRAEGKGGKFSPILVRGAGVDVPCRLRALTEEQHQKRYRQRIKKTPQGELRLAKGRAYTWRLKAQKQGDPMVNALFGRGA